MQIQYSNSCANEILDARDYLECHANTEVNVTLHSTFGNVQTTIHMTVISANADRRSATVYYFAVEKKLQ
jgi:hypothetical protein